MNLALPLALLAAGGVATFALVKQRQASGAVYGGLGFDPNDALAGTELGRDQNGVPEDLLLEGGYTGAFAPGNVASVDDGSSSGDFSWIDELLAQFGGDASSPFTEAAPVSVYDPRPYNTGGKPQVDRGDRPVADNSTPWPEDAAAWFNALVNDTFGHPDNGTEYGGSYASQIAASRSRAMYANSTGVIGGASLTISQPLGWNNGIVTNPNFATSGQQAF